MKPRQKRIHIYKEDGCCRCLLRCSSCLCLIKTVSLTTTHKAKCYWTGPFIAFILLVNEQPCLRSPRTSCSEFNSDRHALPSAHLAIYQKKEREKKRKEKKKARSNACSSCLYTLCSLLNDTLTDCKHAVAVSTPPPPLLFFFLCIF